MSADTVTDAVVAWLGGGHVTGLVQVLDAAPWFLDGHAWDLDSGLGWGAVGVVHLLHEDERRIAMGGAHGGLKEVVYHIGISTTFKYVIPNGYDTTGTATTYRRALNTLLDGIRTRIRADRTLGTSSGGVEIGGTGSIVQAGEGDGTGNPDITIDRDLPTRDGAYIVSRNLIQFQILEVAAT